MGSTRPMALPSLNRSESFVGSDRPTTQKSRSAARRRPCDARPCATRVVLLLVLLMLASGTAHAAVSCEVCSNQTSVVDNDSLTVTIRTLNNESMTCNEYAQSIHDNVTVVATDEECVQIRATFNETCGCDADGVDGEGNNTATDSPGNVTEAPSIAPTVQSEAPSEAPSFGPAPDCFMSIKEVVARERWVFERGDNSIQRTYVMCPNRTYRIGFPTIDLFEFLGEPPIILQSNVHWKCGHDGSSSNNCVIDGGILQVSSSALHFRSDHVNMLVEGFTFQQANNRVMITSVPGDIIMRDCIFRNQETGPINEVLFIAISTDDRRDRNLKSQDEANGSTHTRADVPGLVGDADTSLQERPRPKMIELVEVMESRDVARYESFIHSIYDDNDEDHVISAANHANNLNRRRMQGPPDILTDFKVKFQNCTMENILVTSPNVPLLIGTIECSPSCTIDIDSCIFRNNKVSPDDTLIGSSVRMRAGELSVTNSCFLNNSFLGYNTYLVGDTAKTTNISNNFGTFNQGLFKDCQFMSKIDPTDAIGETVECIHEYDATSCALYPSSNEGPSGGKTDAPSAQQPAMDEPTSAPSSEGAAVGTCQRRLVITVMTMMMTTTAAVLLVGNALLS